MSNQSPHVPKFGDWDVDGKSGAQQAFTLIFANMRADKSTKRVNPNDPEFLAEYFNSSSSSSSSSQAVVHDADSSPPPPSLHESPPPPSNPTSRLSMNQKNQSSHVPKFGEWDVDGENGGEQAFTVIFDNMRADKSMKKVNPNDPAFLADFVNSSSSASSSAQAVIHAVSQPPPSQLRHESPQLYQNQSAHVPKFGEWDVDRKNGGEQAFTVIFDNMRADKSMKTVNPNDPAFLADVVNSSSSSQAARHAVHQPPRSPLRHVSPQPPLKPTSRASMNHKKVLAPKFGNWDVGRPKEYTAIFDELKQEKKQSTHHRPQASTSPTTPFSSHKPFLMSWRLCFSSGQAVKE